MKEFYLEKYDGFFEAISKLTSLEDCRKFFEDVCTIKEIQDMAQRLDVAILLTKGYSYQKITEKVETSTATIGRVSKCLNYGSGGYRKAIEALEKQEEQE